MFGEGKVHQPIVYPQADGVAHLPRFKWGVYVFCITQLGTSSLHVMIRLHQWSDHYGDQCPTPNHTHVANWYEITYVGILLLSDHTCTGFDKLMPEHRPFPYKYFPKMGIHLGVTFGHPIPPDKIMVALNALSRPKSPSPPPGVAENSVRHSGSPTGALHVRGWVESAIVRDPLLEREGAGRCAQMDEIRSEVTAIIQRAVEELGRKVSGNTLGLSLPPQSGDRCVR